MKITTTFLLGLFLSITSIASAQKDEAECRKFRSLAGEEIKAKNYNYAIEMYLKALTFCDACSSEKGDDIVYDNLKYAYYEMWKAEKDEARKKELGDSVVWVYTSRMELCGTVSDKWKASYGYFLNKSKRDYEKAAVLLGDYVRMKEEKAGLSYIYAYYRAVYKTYRKTKLNSWRDTLVNKYFVINDYLDIIDDNEKQKKTADKIRAAIEDILLGKILSDCDEISKVLETKVGQFADLTKEGKLEFCENALAILEKKKCVDSPVYGTLLDFYPDLLLDSLKAEAYYANAKYYEAKGQYKKALGFYKKCVLSNTIKTNNDKYKAGQARMMFRAGQYKACFSLAKSVGGKQRGASLKIAAQCIAQTSNSCGVSTILRKANYYLAMDYLDKAKASGASVSGLMNSYKNSAPTREEKFKENWATGKTITLECWGESTKVRD